LPTFSCAINVLYYGYMLAVQIEKQPPSPPLNRVN